MSRLGHGISRLFLLYIYQKQTLKNACIYADINHIKDAIIFKYRHKFAQIENDKALYILSNFAPNITRINNDVFRNGQNISY